MNYVQIEYYKMVKEIVVAYNKADKWSIYTLKKYDDDFIKMLRLWKLFNVKIKEDIDIDEVSKYYNDLKNVMYKTSKSREEFKQITINNIKIFNDLLEEFINKSSDSV